MLNLGKILGRNYEALNEIRVSRSALIHNYKYLSGLNKNLKIAPVLKSNAYGHGINTVSQMIDSLGAPFVCVDSLYEAYELMKNKVNTQILVMGYVDPKSLQTKKLPFSFVIYDRERLEALSRYQPGAKIHLFVDTGMHREGVRPEELPDLLNSIKSSGLELEGVMSHFAESESPENKLTRAQLQTFDQAVKTVKKFGFNPRWIHIANSSAVLNNKEFDNRLGNMARAGLAFYGINPEYGDDNLTPGLELVTHVSQTKELKKGEKVGYGFSFEAKKDMKIAILPIGYFDGVDRRLSNKGFVKIGDKFCQIVGRVSMNITVIDVSQVDKLKEGDEAIVFSRKRTDKNSFENAAKIIDSIAYDPLIHLDSSIKRVLVD